MARVVLTYSRPTRSTAPFMRGKIGGCNVIEEAPATFQVTPDVAVDPKRDEHVYVMITCDSRIRVHVGTGSEGTAQRNAESFELPAGVWWHSLSDVHPQLRVKVA